MRESDADRAHISCDELPVAVRLDFSAAARTRNFLGIFFIEPLTRRTPIDTRMPYEKHLEFYEKREVTYNYPTTTYYYRYSPFWRDWRWRDWKDWRDWSELRWSNWRLPEIKLPEIKWPEVKWPEVKPALPEKKVTWQSDLLSDRMLKSVTQRNDPPRNDPIVIRLTADQEAVLQEQFKRWPRVPHHADIILLAAETGLSEADVRDWYAIRLAQWRKEQGLGGSLGLH